ncbi:MAG: AAA family ATPase, partial [Candidatus Aenigmarchaeota archaeon]|nr:AAA family ATPase [Candidatus Aenigmarchaeota archaeon]
MRIRKIVLTNYRQYKGRQEISFGFEKDKNINIIVGVNGSGKTNLLNALTWCLYGREEHLAEVSVHHEMLNDSVRAALKPGETAEVSVEIILENEEGWGFRVVRRKLFLKGKENNISSVNEEQTAFIKLPHKKDWDPRAPEFIINYKILPEGVKDFFFFDGERLIKLFEEKTAEKVKDAILNVSQISLIDTTLDHLEKKKIEYYRESKNISPKAKVKELSEKIEATKRALQQLKIEIEEYQKSKHEIEKIIKEIEKKLMGYSEERVRELERQYQELEKEKELLREKIEECEGNFKEFLLSNAPVALLIDALRITQKLINEKYDKGELPPPATEEFLREILDRGCCICGTDISKGEARKKVEDFLETISTIATKLDEECRAIKPEIKNVFNTVGLFLEEKKKLGQEIAEKKRKLEKINGKLREISLKLKKLNIDEIKSLVEQRDSYLQQKEEIIGDLRIAQDRKENGEGQIKEWESELKKELKKEEKLKKLITKIEIVEKCI